MRSGMAAVGFEPTPPKRLVPKTSALDHSAMLPVPESRYTDFYFINEVMLLSLFL